MLQKLRDTTLYYEEYGTGDRYILSTAQIFDPDRRGWPFDLAEEGFHVLVTQMRGYGRSDHVFADHGENWYNIWADDVAEFATTMGIDRFLYTGASDGGGVGWHLCLRHPGRLVGFAGLCAGPHSRSVGAVSPSRAYAIDSAGSEAAMEQLAQYNRQCILYFARKFADDAEKREEFTQKAEAYYRIKLDMKPEELCIQPGLPLAWLSTDEEVLQALAGIHMPVLLINGIQDAMLPPGKALSPMHVIKGAKAVFYQEATHRLYYDRREDLRREIAAFAGEAFALEGEMG